MVAMKICTEVGDLTLTNGNIYLVTHNPLTSRSTQWNKNFILEAGIPHLEN